MQIIARFTESFLTLEEPIPFSERELEWVCHDSDLPSHPQNGSWNQLLALVHGLRDDVPSLGITLLIPTEYTHTRCLDLPGGNPRKSAQAIPYLLEEFLASDIDDQHIVWSAASEGRRACCVAIHHSVMQCLHNSLQSSGVHTWVLLPDALPLLLSQRWGLTLPGRGRALLVDVHGAVGLSLRQLAELGDMNPGHPRPDSGSASHHPDGSVVLQAGSVHALDRFNLLCGPYALRSDNARRHRRLRQAVIALLAVWAAHIGSDALLARHYEGRAEMAHQQLHTLYRDYFPSDAYPADLEHHLASMVRELRNRQRPPLFLSRYQPMVDAFDAAGILDTVKPIDIHYSARTDLLNATLRVPSVAFAEQVVQAIEGSGADVRLLAANTAEDGAVLRIALSGSRTGGIAE